MGARWGEETFPLDVDRTLSTIAQILAARGSTRAASLLKGGRARFEYSGYDNWNGGIHAWELIIEIPLRLYARLSVNERELEEGTLRDTAMELLRTLEAHHIARACLTPSMAEEGRADVAVSSALDPLSHSFIDEQVGKCRAKMAQADYSGAITNARSLVETVLTALELELYGKQDDHKGKIDKHYKHVARKLNLDSGHADLTPPLKQIATGLASVVVGLGALRSKASDAHGHLRPTRAHHARVAVNVAMTLTDFLLSTYEYQRGRS